MSKKLIAFSVLSVLLLAFALGSITGSEGETLGRSHSAETPTSRKASVLPRPSSSLAYRHDARSDQAEEQPPPSPNEGPESVPSAADAPARGSEEEVTQHRVRLDRMVENEPVDNGWASKVADDLRSSIQKVGNDGVEVSVLDCRTTLCKLDLTFEPGSDPGEFMDAIAGKPGFRLPGFAQLVSGEDGYQRIHIFLGRDDDAMPPIGGDPDHG